MKKIYCEMCDWYQKTSETSISSEFTSGSKGLILTGPRSSITTCVHDKCFEYTYTETAIGIETYRERVSGCYPLNAHNNCSLFMERKNIFQILKKLLDKVYKIMI